MTDSTGKEARARSKAGERATAKRAPARKGKGATAKRAPARKGKGATAKRAPARKGKGATAKRAPARKGKGATAKKAVWKTLRHNGIVFPPEHERKGFKVRVRGAELVPTLEQEEMLYQWAKKKGTPYIDDPKFQENFTGDFAKTLDKPLRGISYADIDLAEAYALVDRERDARELLTKEERKEIAAARKGERDALKARHGTAVIDGKDVDVGNYMAEPPGLFIGRGEHPLRGRWKPRIRPEDVTLNLGRGAPVPRLENGGSWKAVVHNNTATWLAMWTDHLTGRSKYIWLADTAEIKQSMDMAKYDKARMLSTKIGEIRARMIKDMSDPEKFKIATAGYLIYRTSMRVGDEKGEDEADTVGATTLRREHVKTTADAVHLDFLGKDSVRWRETIAATGDDARFRDNMERIVADKAPKDQLFDGINSSRVNAYYSQIVPGLSAKVFRTYLASQVVAEYLRGHDDLAGETAHKKLYHAKMANLEAAVKCNHKRTIPKTFEQSLQKKKDALAAVEAKPVDIKGEQRKKNERIAKMEEQAKAAAKRFAEANARRKAAIEKAASRKAKGGQDEARKRKRIAELEARQKKASRDYKAARTKRLAALKKARERPTRAELEAGRKRDRVERMGLQIDLASKTRDYNIGTSLRNYIDPRLFKAWIDEVGAEWSKMYTASLQRKFLWVRDAKFDWKEVSGHY